MRDGVYFYMKWFFEEHTSAIIRCIVVSLLYSYEEKESKTIIVTKDTQFLIYVDGYGKGTTITNNANAKMDFTY